MNWNTLCNGIANDLLRFESPDFRIYRVFYILVDFRLSWGSNENIGIFIPNLWWRLPRGTLIKRTKCRLYTRGSHHQKFGVEIPTFLLDPQDNLKSTSILLTLFYLYEVTSLD